MEVPIWALGLESHSLESHSWSPPNFDSKLWRTLEILEKFSVNEFVN